MYSSTYTLEQMYDNIKKQFSGLNFPVLMSKTKNYSFLANFCSGFSKENMPTWCKQQANLEQPEVTGTKERPSCFECVKYVSQGSASITDCLLHSCLMPAGIIAAIAVGAMFIMRRK